MKIRNILNRIRSTPPLDHGQPNPHTSPVSSKQNTGSSTNSASINKKPNPKKKAFSESSIILQYFRSLDKQGRLFDVGAFSGGTLKPYLNMGWTVNAFEPDPAKHQALFKLASNPNLTVWTCALSDEPKDDLPFFTSPESPGISSLLKFRDSHSVALKVPVRTLEHIVSETGIDSVDYMKIDAEGHDLLVLRGNNWDNFKPNVIMCEFEDLKTRHLGYNYKDLGDYLVDLGYEVLLSEWNPIVRYGIQHEWKSLRHYPCEITNEAGWGNFIAALPGTFKELMPFASPFMSTETSEISE